jgi:hypothetical protein
MNICLFSYSDNQNVYDISYTSFIKYSKYHKYDFIPFNTSLINDDEMKPHWNKLLYAIKLLKNNNNYDYFVWFDHDIIIKNFNISLASIIKEHKFDSSEALAMMSNDPCSNFPFNSGVIVFKNNTGTLKMFETMMELKNLPDKYVWAKNKWKYYKYGSDFSKGIQDSKVIDMYFKQFPRHLLTVPHGILQSFFDKKFYKKGDFCGHVVSYQGGVLVSKMNQLNDDILPWE